MSDEPDRSMQRPRATAADWRPLAAPRLRGEIAAAVDLRHGGAAAVDVALRADRCGRRRCCSPPAAFRPVAMWSRRANSRSPAGGQAQARELRSRLAPPARHRLDRRRWRARPADRRRRPGRRHRRAARPSRDRVAQARSSARPTAAWSRCSSRRCIPRGSARFSSSAPPAGPPVRQRLPLAAAARLALGERGRSAAGVALARAMAMLTYRTPAEFGEPLRRRRRASTEGRRPGRRRGLSRGPGRAPRRADGRGRLPPPVRIDRPPPHRSGGRRVPATFVAVDSDALVPAADVEAFARAVPGARLRVIASRFGHDAFLKEDAEVAAIITEFLDSPGAPSHDRQARSTRAVRAGIDCDRSHGAVVPPITLSANFRFDELDEKPRYDYTRSGNPTRDVLAAALADLEGGAGAVVTATGMGAIAPCCTRCSRRATGCSPRTIATAAAGGCSPRLPPRALFEFETCDFTDPAQLAARSRAGRNWSGSKLRPIRCCGSPTSKP